MRLYVDGYLQLGVNLVGTLCLIDRSASVAVRPYASIVLVGGADATFLIFRAGLQITAEVMRTSVVPKLSVALQNGGKVQACLTLDLEIEPLSVRLDAYFTMMVCIGWRKVCIGRRRWKFCFRVPFLKWWYVAYCQPA